MTPSSSQPTEAILLVNLGSPDSPSEGDVRRYLNEFLMDGYVLDVPAPIRRLIVSMFILPRRPRQSAAAYRSIWWPEGSPLIEISRRVRGRLATKLDVPLELAMRYGNPSIGAALDTLLGAQPGLGRIVVVPLYPHHAMSSTTTVVERVRRELARRRPDIVLAVVPPFYDHPSYIDAMAQRLSSALEQEFDHVLFSYHGLPERHLKKTDPTGKHCLGSPDCCTVESAAHATCYRHQAFRTMALVAATCGLGAEQHSIAFQSRLGRDRWLEPYTDFELPRLARAGVRRLVVLCPAFVSDCLETLEEIGIRGRESFEQAGGTELRLVPCLNDHPVWIDSLATIIRESLAGSATGPGTRQPPLVTA